MGSVRKPRPVIMLAQTPPPFHGQAIMTQVLKEVLQGEFEVYHVRMDFSDTVAENKKLRFSKVWKLFSNLWKTVSLLRKHPGAVLYYPPAPGHWVPVLRDLVLLTICRPFAGSTVFHFHARGVGEFLEQHKHCPRRAWRTPDHAIVLGPSARRDAELLGATVIHEVPYGVDVALVEGGSPKAARPRIFFAGFHAESKGVFDLLETARVLRDRQIDFEIQTAGEWASMAVREHFYSLLESYELEDRVTPLGLLSGPDLQTAYAAADIFFFPTFFEHETFGVVVVEAMAHSLPVVASAWPGPIDIICDKESGFLCPPRTIDAYADVLRKLIESSDLRSALGAAGRELYEDKYTRAVYGESMRKLFAEICNDAG